MNPPARIDGMTKRDVALLLAFIASYDQRTVGEADVEAWHLVAQYAKWNAEGARRGVVDHYTEKRQRLMPADITAYLRSPAETGGPYLDF